MGNKAKDCKRAQIIQVIPSNVIFNLLDSQESLTEFNKRQTEWFFWKDHLTAVYRSEWKTVDTGKVWIVAKGEDNEVPDEGSIQSKMMKDELKHI